VSLRAIFRLQAAAATLVAVTALVVAACGGGGGGGNCNPAPTGTPVGLLLTGETAQSTADGMVLGYFNGTNGMAPNGSGLVNLTANQNVQFINTEGPSGLPHTASFLGPYSGSYPSTFTNTNGATASAAGAAISSANFSSGNLNPGVASAIYNSGGPGMFIFGCFYHYVKMGMRTVIIVH
jgi:hypothetical protein